MLFVNPQYRFNNGLIYKSGWPKVGVYEFFVFRFSCYRIFHTFNIAVRFIKHTRENWSMFGSDTIYKDNFTDQIILGFKSTVKFRY